MQLLQDVRVGLLRLSQLGRPLDQRAIRREAVEACWAEADAIEARWAETISSMACEGKTAAPYRRAWSRFNRIAGFA